MNEDKRQIIAVSDMHLGIEESNEKEFNKFLNEIRKWEVEDLVICGDGDDPWRRHPYACAREDVETFHLLKEMQESGIRVHYLRGNHDSCADSVDKEFFSTNYEELLQLENGRYEFLHGHQFDPVFDLIPEEVLDAMALTTDPIGKGLDEVWNVYQQSKSFFKRFADWLLNWRGGKKKEFRKKLKKADSATEILEDRLIYKRVSAYFGERNVDLGIFGHTHYPLLCETIDCSWRSAPIANCGSWVKDSTPNTAVQILPDHRKVYLLQYDGGFEVMDKLSY